MGFDLVVCVVFVVKFICLFAFDGEGGWVAVDAVDEEVLAHDKVAVLKDRFVGEAVVLEHQVLDGFAVGCAFG